MYSEKMIVFVDLLGFRKLIETTDTNLELEKSIFKVLNSLKSDNLSNEAFGHVNTEIIPPEELMHVQNIMNLMAKSVKSQSSLRITHFSDSIVMSADLKDGITMNFLQ